MPLPTENQEHNDDQSVDQPEPMYLGVEDVAISRVNQGLSVTVDGRVSANERSQIHIPSQRPRDVGVDPTDAITEP
jgi:hypothetical protein